MRDFYIRLRARIEHADGPEADNERKVADAAALALGGERLEVAGPEGRPAGYVVDYVTVEGISSAF